MTETEDRKFAKGQTVVVTGTIGVHRDFFGKVGTVVRYTSKTRVQVQADTYLFTCHEDALELSK